jgi:hypothetical protein
MSLNLVLETISFRDLCPALALHSFLVASGGAKIDRAQHRRTISTAGTERDAEDKEWRRGVGLETGFVDDLMSDPSDGSGWRSFRIDDDDIWPRDF